MLLVKQLKEFLADVEDGAEVVTGDYHELFIEDLYKDEDKNDDQLVVIG